MKLICDVDAIQARFGLDPVGQLLFTTIRLDSGRMVTPVLADRDGTQVLLARQQELGNLLSSGVSMDDLKIYDPYVTFEDRLKTVAASASFADAVVELAAGQSVTVGEDFPYFHHRAVTKLIDLTVEPSGDNKAVAVYELDASSILAKFRGWREHGVEIATPIVDRVDGLDGLSAEFTSDVDTRYSALEALADELGVPGFLISSPPNFSEVTGIRASSDLSVLWIRASGRVLVIASTSRFDTLGVPLGVFTSLGEAVKAHVAAGPIGVEDQWLQIGHAQQLEGLGFTLTSASNRLGAWRDARDREDLPFQILAARTSVFCIEGALDYAERELAAGNTPTENDVYRRYLELIHEFRASNGIPFTIEPYFVNLHASNRMLYPGPGTDFVLDSELKCLMLDAGVKFSIDGVVLATSDMARSLMLTPEGIQAYELFKTVVREGIVGQLAPGVVMSDVHEGTMAVVTNIRTQIEALGLLAPDVDFVAQYRKRNVGHLMGKQESFANELRPGYDHVLTVGDLGAAELPWLFGEYAVGTEDMWYIGKDRTYITSL